MNKICFARLIFLLILSSFTFAQDRYGPVGPGQGSFIDNHIRGHFADWDRQATPSLVLNSPGNRVLRIFADIDSEGNFELNLPEITANTPLGSKICGDPAKGLISVLINIDLLTPLDGFTTPNEANNGLSVIGMALFADKAFSQNIGVPGTKRVQWFASHTARTVEVGECNNENSFDINAGWTAVTVISGPSGGPHTYHSGIDEGIGWYWFAFDEEPKEVSAPELITAMPVGQHPDWLIGEWNSLEVDTRINLNLGASGEGKFESIEGRIQTLEIKWAVDNDVFTIVFGQDADSLGIEKLSDVSFKLFDTIHNRNLFFNKAGVKVRPSFLVGEWQAQDQSNRELTLEVDGNFTLTSEDSSLMGIWAQQDYELVLENTDESSIIRYELFSLLESGFVVKEQPNNTKVVFLKK